MWEVWEAPDVVSALGTLLAGVAACLGVYVAARGLTSWKTQKRWENDHELARKILVELYRLKNAMVGVRRPLVSVAEMYPRDGQFNSNDDRARYDGLVRAYEARWDKVISSREKLSAYLVEAEVLWGGKLSQHYRHVDNLETKLWFAIREYLDSQDPRSSNATREAYAERLRNHEDIVFQSSDDDVFDAEFKSALSPLEVYLKEKIGSQV